LRAQFLAGRLVRLRTGRFGLRLAWFLVAVIAGIIFALSATPNLRVSDVADLDFILRKAGHMAAFGLLAGLLWNALDLSSMRRPMPWALVLTIAYAASDEFHQSFTSGRHASPVDVSIDSAGAIIALTAVAVVVWLRARRMVE
jgi:VanZ family protein